MRVLKTFRPGEPGAKRLRDRFGTSLVCVRYRHDPLNDARVTTVELVVEATRVRQRSVADRSSELRPVDRIVAVKVHYRETALRERVKQAGGRWRPDERTWELPLSVARRLGLADRVVRQRGRDGSAAGRSDHGNT